MRKVIWTDEMGRKHRSYVRDADPDDMAPEGFLQDPPDVVNGIDWHKAAITLHNQLLERELFTRQDIEGNPNSFTGAIFATLRRDLITLYRAVSA